MPCVVAQGLTTEGKAMTRWQDVIEIKRRIKHELFNPYARLKPLRCHSLCTFIIMPSTGLPEI